MRGTTPRSRPRPRPRVAEAIKAMGEPEGPLHDTPAEAALLRDAIRSQGMDIDELIEKYAGKAVPLDRAFPSPPPPVPDPRATAAERPAQALDPYPIPSPSTTPDIGAEGAARREYQLKMLQRLSMRGASLPQIAQALDMNLPDVYRLRSELHRRLEAEAGNVSMLTHLGMALGFYDEIRQQMLRQMDGPTNAQQQPGQQPASAQLSHVDRARYAATALAAENSKHRFLYMAGFYKNAQVQPKPVEPEEQNEMDVLGTALRAMLDPDAYTNEMGEVLEGELVKPSQPTEDELIRVIG